MRLDDRLAAVFDVLDGDFVPSVVAEKFVAQVREQEPDALIEWLDEHAVAFVTDRIARNLGVQRRAALHQAKVRKFDATTDDPEKLLSQFAVVYVVDEDNTRRRVADMTGDNHAFVADAYECSGRYDLMLAAFHRSVAKRVGKKRTADVLTEAKYEQLLRSIATPT